MRRFTSESLEEWKASPLTQVFLAYLKDRQARLAAQWARGEALSPECQVKAQLLGELSAPEWEDYEAFYGVGEDQRVDANGRSRGSAAP